MSAMTNRECSIASKICSWMSGAPEVARLMRRGTNPRPSTSTFRMAGSITSSNARLKPAVKGHCDEDLVSGLVPHERLEVCARVQALSSLSYSELPNVPEAIGFIYALVTMCG
jgi:hypothetical protein